MPVEVTQRQVGMKSTGEQLLERGIKEVEGEAVQKKAIYKGMATYQAPVNHLRQMKKAYDKKGVDGVVGYIDGVLERAEPKKDPNQAYVESQQTTPQVVSWPGM